MTRTVHCVLLKTDADGLDFVPWPGELGQRIYNQVSKQAWQRWIAHQTTLINEYRLNPLQDKDRAYLTEQMERFLFLGEVTHPPGYLMAHGTPESEA
ncbi:MAG: oxidative damage protection protein [Rhodanobacter sp.]